MPGGSGPIGKTVLSVGSGARRTPSLSISAGEAALFYNLHVGCVYYDREHAALYFVESRHAPAVADVASSVLGRPLEAEQLHLDRHGFFCGARRAHLPPREAAVVLVALRLAGFEILGPQGQPG